MSKTRVLANHAHVFPAEMNPDGTIERLLKLLDACAIDQAVCFAPFPHQCGEHELSDPNVWLAEQLNRRRRDEDRLLGFGTIDFARSDLPGQVRHISELGLKGIKLHPNAQEFDILSPRLFELYAAAQEQQLVLAFHTGV